jgi:hypothetical protein
VTGGYPHSPKKQQLHVANMLVEDPFAASGSEGQTSFIAPGCRAPLVDDHGRRFGSDNSATASRHFSSATEPIQKPCRPCFDIANVKLKQPFYTRAVS